MFCLPLCGADRAGLGTQDRWVERKITSDGAGGSTKSEEEDEKEEERLRDRETNDVGGNKVTLPDGNTSVLLN